jgi:hypothetical protein
MAATTSIGGVTFTQYVETFGYDLPFEQALVKRFFERLSKLDYKFCNQLLASEKFKEFLDNMVRCGYSRDQASLFDKFFSSLVAYD